MRKAGRGWSCHVLLGRLAELSAKRTEMFLACEKYNIPAALPDSRKNKGVRRIEDDRGNNIYKPFRLFFSEGIQFPSILRCIF